MCAQGHEVAFFLKRFIRANKVPPLEEVEEEGRKRIIGGVAVCAWSFGNIYHTALFAHLASLEDESRNFLERYLRTIIYLGRCCSCATRRYPADSSARRCFLPKRWYPSRRRSIPPTSRCLTLP